MDEKSQENILIHGILYKTLILAKPLRIRCHKVDGFINVYDAYLVLFGPEKCNNIYDRSAYLIGLKGGFTYVFFSHLYENQS